MQESNVRPDNFFHCQKGDMTSSVTRSERYKYFSSFLKYNFCNKSARKLKLSTYLHTVSYNHICKLSQSLATRLSSCLFWFLFDNMKNDK